MVRPGSVEKPRCAGHSSSADRQTNDIPEWATGHRAGLVRSAALCVSLTVSRRATQEEQFKEPDR